MNLEINKLQYKARNASEFEVLVKKIACQQSTVLTQLSLPQNVFIKCFRNCSL